MKRAALAALTVLAAAAAAETLARRHTRHTPAPATPGRCGVCRCTDRHACQTRTGPCAWVMPPTPGFPGLCTACLHEALTGTDPNHPGADLILIREHQETTP